MTQLFLDSAWKVVAAGLLLGAGLPALFAVGVRATAVPQGSAGAPTRASSPAHRLLAVLCFTVVVIAVALGLSVIIATGFGKELSFEHIWPTLADKA
jgi:hypothetical protein